MVVYAAQGGAVAVTTAAAPTAPVGVLAGDALLLFISSNTASLANISDTPATTAGYTPLGSTSGGGLVAKIYGKCPAVASDSGAAVSFTAITSGTKGVAQILRYTPNAGGKLSVTGTAGSDTDTTTTAFSATGTSVTSDTDDVFYCYWAAVAPTGTYTAAIASTAVALAQAGATVGTRTGRLAALTGTNTISYGCADARMTAGGTGAPSVTGTATGANAGGPAAFVFIDERSMPILVLPPRR